MIMKKLLLLFPLLLSCLWGIAADEFRVAELRCEYRGQPVGDQYADAAIQLADAFRRPRIPAGRVSDSGGVRPRRPGQGPEAVVGRTTQIRCLTACALCRADAEAGAAL